MYRLRSLLLLAPVVLLTGCASEAERACKAAHAPVEAEYRSIGTASAVALPLLLAVTYLARHPVRPGSPTRALGAILVFAPALGSVGLLGLMLGQIAGQNTRTCQPDEGIFSEDDGAVLLVVVAFIAIMLLTISGSLSAAAWSLWRSRPKHP